VWAGHLRRDLLVPSSGRVHISSPFKTVSAVGLTSPLASVILRAVHHLRIHVQHFAVGVEAPLDEMGDETSMLARWLEIDGVHVAEHTHSDEVAWSIVGAAPAGFMFLEFFRPPDELRERFSPSEVMEILDIEDDGDLLRLPIRSIELVPYRETVLA
jgi:hypothetical protein